MQSVPLELHSAQLVQLNMAVLPQLYFISVARCRWHCRLYLHHKPFPWPSTTGFWFFFQRLLPKNRGSGGKDYYVGPHSLDWLTNSKTISISVLYIYREHYSPRDTGPICLRTWKASAHYVLLMGEQAVLVFDGIHYDGFFRIWVGFVLSTPVKNSTLRLSTRQLGN